MLRGAVVDWYLKKPQAPEEDEDEVRWCGIAAAVDSLVHWRAVLGDIGPVEDAAIITYDPYPLPMRAKMRRVAVDTIDTMEREGIMFREFPDENDRGHKWCPVCCSQADGDGA